MNRWLVPAVLLFLSGCSSTLDLKSPDAPLVSGTLALGWVQPHAIEIELDGMRYIGDWTSSVCRTDGCRGIFRNVLKIHRRHIQHGQATLTAKNGSRLDCEWVSHLPEVDGSCRAQDGRLFKLKSGGGAATTPKPASNSGAAMP